MKQIGCGHRRNGVVVAGVMQRLLATTSAHAGGLFLYEMATPDLGTASAGRAAAADNAATAFGNPAGMTRLDQSQMLVGIQPAYGITHFDKDNETTISGGNGGNALGFIPGARRLLTSTAPRPISSSASRWAPTSASPRATRATGPADITPCRRRSSPLGAFPVAAYRINRWLSIGGGAQIIYGQLNSKTGINDVFGGGNASIDISSQRRRLWRHRRYPHRAGRGNALRRHLHLPGQARLQGKAEDQQPRAAAQGCARPFRV